MCFDYLLGVGHCQAGRAALASWWPRTGFSEGREETTKDTKVHEENHHASRGSASHLCTIIGRRMPRTHTSQRTRCVGHPASIGQPLSQNPWFLRRNCRGSGHHIVPTHWESGKIGDRRDVSPAFREDLVPIQVLFWPEWGLSSAYSDSMPWGLKRFQETGHSHFVTFSCYHRQPCSHPTPPGTSSKLRSNAFGTSSDSASTCTLSCRSTSPFW